MYKTLEEAKDFFKQNGPSGSSNNLEPRYEGPGWEDRFETIPNTSRYRLRFDVVLPVSSPFTPEEQLDNIFGMFQIDLEDLAENGDINNTSDVLLKSADGAKKRGMEVDDVIVYEAILYKEQKKHSIEYTLFMLGRGIFK